MDKFASNGPKFVAITGNIGAGKSTLVEFLCKYYGFKPFYEPYDQNPYLKDFYRDMKGYGFKSQMYFLAHKFKMHMDLQDAVSNDSDARYILDRTIYEDAEIFAKHLYLSKFIDSRDFQLYSDMYQSILRSLRTPDVMIYLNCSVATTMKRITMRGRDMEKNISRLYIRKLNDLYKEWVEGYRDSKILKISTESLNYISDFIHRDDLVKQIESHIGI